MQSNAVSNDRGGNTPIFRAYAYGYYDPVLSESSGFSASACLIEDLAGYDDPDNPTIFESRKANRWETIAVIMALVAVAECPAFPDRSIIEVEAWTEAPFEEDYKTSDEWMRLQAVIQKRQLKFTINRVSRTMRRLIDKVQQRVHERSDNADHLELMKDVEGGHGSRFYGEDQYPWERDPFDDSFE